jgi:hypothetical protein
MISRDSDVETTTDPDGRSGLRRPELMGQDLAQEVLSARALRTGEE